MSLVRCRTKGCPHWTREGYRDNPYMEADGVFCWRCRREMKRQDERAARRAKQRPPAQAQAAYHAMGDCDGPPTCPLCKPGARGPVRKKKKKRRKR